VKIDPQPIDGPWTEGFTLDRHVESTVPTGGFTPSGFKQFETRRTELGELVYQLKYGGKKDGARLIAAVAFEFVRERWGEAFDVVVPAPPSVAQQSHPLIQIASELADALDLPLITNALGKAKATALLREGIQKGPGNIAGRRVLLIDDVTEFGVMLRRSAEVLLADAGARSVHALVITRT
jgi:predicted amidophosphoribosyltransferase